MHIDIIDDLNFIIYLNNMQIKNVDFNKKDDFEEYFKNLFTKLKKINNIEFSGFYNIYVYKDHYYGVILEIEKEDIDYIDYFDGQVDMSITLKKDNIFLYKIDDYFNINKKLNNKIKVYHYKDNIYVQIINKLSTIEIAQILEFSKIIYNETDKIIKFGKEITI